MSACYGPNHLCTHIIDIHNGWYRHYQKKIQKGLGKSLPKILLGHIHNILNVFNDVDYRSVMMAIESRWSGLYWIRMLIKTYFHIFYKMVHSVSRRRSWASLATRVKSNANGTPFFTPAKLWTKSKFRSSNWIICTTIPSIDNNSSY